MMELLLMYEESPIGIYIRESLWGYPVILSTHGVGMAIVYGCAIGLNMRVLGFASGISIPAFDRIFIVGWIGFFLNLVSGLVLFAGSATDYVFQGAFQLKIGLIVLGGVLMKVVMNAVRGSAGDNLVKVYSASCLAAWTGAVITGRLMAYLG